MEKTNHQKIIQLFKRDRVLDLTTIQNNLNNRSRRSVFRDLLNVDYFSSFSHGGKYYTLRETPIFDSYGLWFYNDIGFSRHGTLGKTIIYLINSSKSGMKHGELKDILRIPTYNTLLDLVNLNQIERLGFESSYLYLSKDDIQVQTQMLEAQERRAGISQKQIPQWVAIEVLAEVIRQNGADAEPLKIAAKLSLRGIQIEYGQVKQVLEIFDVKKTLPAS